MAQTDFKNAALSRQLINRINELAAQVDYARYMEVCGTHTMEIGRIGLRSILPANVDMVSGPGCPVCVTPASYIDAAVALALEKNVRVVTFGDMVRVPGLVSSLERARGQGGSVQVATSPLRAVEIARENPAWEVVFLAVGFETTIPTIARCITMADELQLTNLSFLCSFHLVPPALEVLIADPQLALTGFLLPGHASAIIGSDAYGLLLRSNSRGVIAGFEPLDILAGIVELLQLQVDNRHEVRNQYSRVVKPEGNRVAQGLMAQVFRVADVHWRGIGLLPQSGLKIQPRYHIFDAEQKYAIDLGKDAMPAGCSCGEVLKGRIKPDRCPLFGKTCTPDHPVGPCMVSSEGSCAAYFRFEARKTYA